MTDCQSVFVNITAYNIWSDIFFKSVNEQAKNDFGVPFHYRFLNTLLYVPRVYMWKIASDYVRVVIMI